MFPKELHTFSKMNHVSIKVTALEFIKSLLVFKELRTLVLMNHVSIDTSFKHNDQILILSSGIVQVCADESC